VRNGRCLARTLFGYCAICKDASNITRNEGFMGKYQLPALDEADSCEEYSFSSIGHFPFVK
jgi:hypothetical protein